MRLNYLFKQLTQLIHLNKKNVFFLNSEWKCSSFVLMTHKKKSKEKSVSLLFFWASLIILQHFERNLKFWISPFTFWFTNCFSWHERELIRKKKILFPNIKKQKKQKIIKVSIFGYRANSLHLVQIHRRQMTLSIQWEDITPYHFLLIHDRGNYY